MSVLPDQVFGPGASPDAWRAKKLGLASLAHLDPLRPTGAVLITPPLKIAKGSDSPLRVPALVAEEHDPEKWDPVFGKDHGQTKS